VLATCRNTLAGPTAVRPTETPLPPTETPYCRQQPRAAHPDRLCRFFPDRFINRAREKFRGCQSGRHRDFQLCRITVLNTQITQGAAADVFASANRTYMDSLVTAYMVAQDAPKDL